MIATYTHWTLPRRRPGARYVFDWPSKTHELLAWALSTTLAARHVGDVEIVTDAAGYDDLAWIGLPATLHVLLDDRALAEIAPYWTGGKLVTYQRAMLRERFVHLDADLFLTKPLPAAFWASTLGTQSVEPLSEPSYGGYYLPTLYALRERAGIPPTVASDMRSPIIQTPAYNCGIVVAGGAGRALLVEAARDGVALLERAARATPDLPASNVCVSAEQYVLAAYARGRGVKVTTLLSAPASHPRAQAEAERLGFVHLFGDAKRSPDALARLVARARAECPALAARILARYPL